MSDTPRTDMNELLANRVTDGCKIVSSSFARELEREIAILEIKVTHMRMTLEVLKDVFGDKFSDLCKQMVNECLQP